MKFPIRPFEPGFRAKPPMAYSRFDSTYTQTIDLLARELSFLDASNITVLMDVEEREVRQDQQLRANARPKSGAVGITFNSKHGPLRYQTEMYRDWQDNLRAIALSLEALRKVDRYGVSQSGEQYRGWGALPAGFALSTEMTLTQAADFLIEYGEWGGERGRIEDLIEDPYVAQAYYKEAAKRLHPDTGGDADKFKQLTIAKAVLDEFHKEQT